MVSLGCPAEERLRRMWAEGGSGHGRFPSKQHDGGSYRGGGCGTQQSPVAFVHVGPCCRESRCSFYPVGPSNDKTKMI